MQFTKQKNFKAPIFQKTEVSQGSESASNSQGSSEEPSAPASASHEISAEPVIFETAAVSNNGESTSNQGTPQI
uniref:Uncharacterized protein n=1 Tax=Caenorhabditis japonica TaxID=281687 RepID=A0A8R1EKV3_CAEJA